jgi:hypothetical protein
MANAFDFPRRPDDDADYLDWLAGREDEIADQPHWLTLEPIDLEEEFAREPPPMREVTAKRGDSISRLLGTSDPAAIGAFGRVNGLRPGDSEIYAGRQYFLPLGASDEDRGEGLLMIQRDNSRLAYIERQRRIDEARRQAQLQALDLALDQGRYIPKYPRLATNAPAVDEPAQQTRKQPDFEAQLDEFTRSAISRLPPGWNNHPRARAIGGFIANEIGKNIGLATGAVKTVKGVGEGALFGARLLNPLDPILSDPGDAAWDHLFGGIGSAIDYGVSRGSNLELLKGDVSSGWDWFRQAHDPSATAPGATLAAEVQRQLNIGKNNGELGVEVASIFAGAPAIKALGRAGAFSRASTAADFAAQGWPVRAIPRLLEPYDGMGHHNIRRSWGKKYDIPVEIVESPLFLVDGKGMNFGDFQRRHAGLDLSVRGGNTGGGWSAKKMGMRRYSLPERLWYGTPPLMKGAIGTGAAIGVASAEQAQKR